jgi:DNA repair protein RadC
VGKKEDIEITRRLREVDDIMGVRVLDDVIVGKARYVSFGIGDAVTC